MKRSDFRKVLESKLKMLVESDDYNVLTSELLTFLEDIGMQGPKYTYWNRDSQGNLRPSARNGDEVTGWEPE